MFANGFHRRYNTFFTFQCFFKASEEPHSFAKFQHNMSSELQTFYLLPLYLTQTRVLCILFQTCGCHRPAESKDLLQYLQNNGLVWGGEWKGGQVYRGDSWNLHYMSCLLNIHKEMFYGAGAELLERKGADRRVSRSCASVSPCDAFS